MNILRRTRPLRAQPLGVVTNNLREEMRQSKKTTSVYTQLVLELKVEPTDSFLQSFIPSARTSAIPTSPRNGSSPGIH